MSAPFKTEFPAFVDSVSGLAHLMPQGGVVLCEVIADNVNGDSITMRISPDVAKNLYAKKLRVTVEEVVE